MIWPLVCNLTDVMPSRVKSVHSRHTPLCQATDREGEFFNFIMINVYILKKNRLINIISNYSIYTKHKWVDTTCLMLFVQNEAEKVVVVIMDKEHHPVERFVFEISQPPLLSIRWVTLGSVFLKQSLCMSFICVCWVFLCQLRDSAVPCGAAAESSDPKNQCVWRCSRQQSSR